MASPSSTRAPGTSEIARQIEAERQRRHADPIEAVELLGIAEKETGLSWLVDDGTCNARFLSPGMRARVRAIGGCDGGHAFTMWQFHPATMRDVTVGTTGPEFVQDRPLTIRVAWDLLEVRPRAWTTWWSAQDLTIAWVQGHEFPQESTR